VRQDFAQADEDGVEEKHGAVFLQPTAPSIGENFLRLARAMALRHAPQLPSMKFLRSFFAAAALATSAFAQQAPQNREQWLIGQGVAGLAEIFASDPARSRPVSARLEVLEAKGLPEMFHGATVELSLRAPDRLRLSLLLDGKPLHIGRRGPELWVWSEAKRFAVLGSPDVPRFATRPDSQGTTPLGPLAPPIPMEQLALLPFLSVVEKGAPETIGSERCYSLRVRLQPAAREALKLADLQLTVWLSERDDFPVQCAVSDGRGLSLRLAILEGTLDAALPDSRWELPRDAAAQAERVSAAHLQRFLAQLLGSITDPPAANPADGARRVVATHGQGRLEMHDGNRVLFLRGTPEEMGGQHGTLLRAQVGQLVDRVLYGVGVGSSFEKGEWFFGTLERCAARVGRFTDPRFEREMLALARASGRDPEEIRLANFFPELFHCSGFALLGAATQGGRVFHGRVLDYMKGVGLEPNAAVIVHQPDAGHAWVNVGYAGFIGTVTAMNDQHLSIGEMGGRGEGNWDGKPMAQLLREVMEKASTLDEAIAILRAGPRTCEYYYVLADGRARRAVGIKATPEIFEVIREGEPHPQLPSPVRDTVLLSADERYAELARRVQAGFGAFTAETARALMTRPVCMTSNIHSVLFAPDTLDFWVANSDGKTPASHLRYTQYNLGDLLGARPASR
jgi:hypothetical protein